jgi:hypothetical protein
MVVGGPLSPTKEEKSRARQYHQSITGAAGTWQTAAGGRGSEGLLGQKENHQVAWT